MLTQEEQNIATEQLKQFVARYGDMKIQSTSAKVVYYADDLYNVDGSSDDPYIDGKKWKPLLQAYGISGNCYANTPVPQGITSHPAFSVGGHMTPNADGDVPIGGDCYLMPLCSWHNNTARNGQVFEHTQTKMLELSGYMQGEPAATFLARMSGEAPLSLVFLGEEGLSYRNIPDAPGAVAKALACVDGPSGAPFLLFRQHSEGDVVTYTVEDARF
jgi:hypothetical protein